MHLWGLFDTSKCAPFAGDRYSLCHQKNVDTHATRSTMNNNYNDEAYKRWGHTKEFSISKKRTSSYTKEDWKRIRSEATLLYQAFHELSDVHSSKAMELVAKWQSHISTYYYPCSLGILEGLGKMYIEDDRFMESIDAHGEGTAQKMSSAIAFFCSNP